MSPFRALGSIQNAAHALQEVCFCKEGSSSGDGLCGPGSYSGIGQSSCIECDFNTFAASGSSACLPCNKTASYYALPGAAECKFMEHDPVIWWDRPTLPDICPHLQICCSLATGEDDLLGDCKDCNCSLLFAQQPLYSKLLHATSRNERFSTLSHVSSHTFVLFPVSNNSWQVVFFDSELSVLKPAERVEKLRKLALSGALDDSIVKLKIGDHVVMAKVKRNVFSTGVAFPSLMLIYATVAGTKRLRLKHTESGLNHPFFIIQCCAYFLVRNNVTRWASLHYQSLVLS